MTFYITSTSIQSTQLKHSQNTHTVYRMGLFHTHNDQLVHSNQGNVVPYSSTIGILVRKALVIWSHLSTELHEKFHNKAGL